MQKNILNISRLYYDKMITEIEAQIPIITALGTTAAIDLVKKQIMIQKYQILRQIVLLLLTIINSQVKT